RGGGGGGGGGWGGGGFGGGGARGAAAADRDGLGRDVRGRGGAGGARLHRGTAAARDQRHRPPAGPARELDRAGAGVVAGGGGHRLRGRHRGGPAAGGQTGLVHRHDRGAVRDPVRLAGPGPAADTHPVRGRGVHPRGDRPGPSGREGADR